MSDEYLHSLKTGRDKTRHLFSKDKEECSISNTIGFSRERRVGAHQTRKETTSIPLFYHPALPPRTSWRVYMVPSLLDIDIQLLFLPHGLVLVLCLYDFSWHGTSMAWEKQDFAYLSLLLSCISEWEKLESCIYFQSFLPPSPCENQFPVFREIRNLCFLPDHGMQL